MQGIRDRTAEIREMEREAGACVACRKDKLLYRHTNGKWARPLFHLESKCTSGILIVLEAPSLEDTIDPDKRRLTCNPDTDPSARFAFDRLRDLGLTPEDVLFTNAVLCLPDKREGRFPVNMKQVNRCRPWLIKCIERLDPGVVVTLGGLALNALGRIEDHGLKTISEGVGRLRPWFGRQLLPLFHTTTLGRVNRSRDQQLDDWQKLEPYLKGIGWEPDQNR